MCSHIIHLTVCFSLILPEELEKIFSILINEKCVVSTWSYRDTTVKRIVEQEKSKAMEV